VRDESICKETKNNYFLETFYKNDARCRIKTKLNKLTSSHLIEHKSYPGSKIVISACDNIDEYNKKWIY